jgi:hypothetical protein
LPECTSTPLRALQDWSVANVEEIQRTRAAMDARARQPV